MAGGGMPVAVGKGSWRAAVRSLNPNPNPNPLATPPRWHALGSCGLVSEEAGAEPPWRLGQLRDLSRSTLQHPKSNQKGDE